MIPGVAAATIALAILGFAASIRGVTLPGLLLGGFVVLAGLASWSSPERIRYVVWAVLGIQGLVFAAWTFPWIRDLAKLPHVGGAWLGLAFWLLGIAGAALAGHGVVALQRLAYAGLAVLTGLAVLAAVRTGRDPTIGVVVAFLIAIGAVLLAGAGNAFDDVHPVPDTVWGLYMEHRFWGGSGLLYHPNSLAALAVVVALRIGPDRAFRAWQRLASLGVLGLVLALTESRTGLLFAGAAACVHAVLVWRGRRDLPGRVAVASAVVPFLVLGTVFLVSGSAGFLTTSRYQAVQGERDVTSGRLDTWAAAWRDFRGDSLAEQAFGNADQSRGAIEREPIGPRAERPLVGTDNAAVGALRRGGVLGVAAFAIGLFLLVRHALRRAPAWFTIAALASLATLMTSDWLLGSAGGTLWIFLFTAEAWVVSAGGPHSRTTQP